MIVQTGQHVIARFFNGKIVNSIVNREAQDNTLHMLNYTTERILGAKL